MRSSGQVPYVPTGYEGLQSQAASKRKIAEALLAQGLQGPGPNARSWAQVLGSIAQAWAGKSLQKDADKLDEQVRQQQLAANAVVQQGIEADVRNGMTPQELMTKWGGIPQAQERLKQFDQPLTNVNGTFINPRNVKEGSQAPQDPNALVTVGPDGSRNINIPRVVAGAASAGMPLTDANGQPMPTHYPAPGAPNAPVVNALMNQQPPVQMAPLDLQQNWTKGPETMGGQAAADASFAAQQPRFEVNPAGTQEIKKLPDGRTAYKVNGEWYDNPEGK